MTEPLRREPLADGVWFSCIHDAKFKHNSISATMLMPLEDGKSAVTALVPYLLRMGSRRCPDMTQLECRLSDLYGAVLDADVTRSGEYQLLTLSVSGADDRFSLEPGESISRGCAELLGEILLEPNVIDGAFPEDIFRVEQQSLIDSIAAEINEKRSYALQRCLREMGKGCRFSIPRYGSVEEAAAVTSAAVYQRYCEVLKTARIEIFFSGCGSPDYARETFRRIFGTVERTPGKHISEQPPLFAGSISRLEESLPMRQSKLVMGFRTGAPQERKKRNALRLMTALLGGSSGSRLFTRVREKLGACYYCSARVNILSGILTVDCGLEEGKRELLENAVLQQIADLAAGNISEDELAAVRSIYISSLRAMSDSLGRLEGWYLSGLIHGEVLTPEEDIEEMLAVTAEEIAAAAGALTLDTVFFLRAEASSGEVLCDEE